KVSDPFGKSSVMVRPLLVLVAVQVMLGGLMSGMKAGFAYPTFPMMNGEWLPSILFDSSQWTLNNMKEYDSGNMFAPALIQVLHRLMAYTIFVLGIIFGYRAYKHRVNGIFRFSVRLFLSLLIVQVVLGIFTLLGCQSGKVPLTLGVMHQAVGLLTLSAIVFVWYLKTHLAQYR
ncbi:MAG TPA: heme A synthase, partial [Saprospiraceae bacterium]|nr:heme A synthase [Saprospiraceae bacterium]